MNIDICLLALLLNESEFYEKFTRYNCNPFQNETCQKIYGIMQKIKSNNKQKILNYETMDEHAFNEIYTHPYSSEQYQEYSEEVLKNFFIEDFRRYYNQEIFTKHKEIRLDDIKDKISFYMSDKRLFEDRDIVHVRDVAVKVLQAYLLDTAEHVNLHIPYFDDRGGIERTDYIILAARSSVGKTTWALNNILSCLENHERIGFITMETEKEKITSLLACIKAGIEEWRFRSRCIDKMGQAKLKLAFEFLHQTELYIEDSPGLDIETIRSKEKTLVRKYGCQKIYIDYLSYIALPKGCRDIYTGVTHNSKMLKALCREFKVPHIVLAQLNRENEKAQREPKKSDLRDSGQIEQDADIINLLHQDFENTTSGMIEGESVRLKNIVEKWRNGPTGYFYQTFNKKLRKIY